jgi:hypothetical protein
MLGATPPCAPVGAGPCRTGCEGASAGAFGAGSTDEPQAPQNFTPSDIWEPHLGQTGIELLLSHVSGLTGLSQATCSPLSMVRMWSREKNGWGPWSRLCFTNGQCQGPGLLALWPPWASEGGAFGAEGADKQAGTATQGTNGNVKDKEGRCDSNGQLAWVCPDAYLASTAR